jgi:hypothetical protein
MTMPSALFRTQTLSRIAACQRDRKQNDGNVFAHAGTRKTFDNRIARRIRTRCVLFRSTVADCVAVESPYLLAHEQ